MSRPTPTITRRGLLLGAAGTMLAACVPDLGDGTLASWCSPEPSDEADQIPQPVLAAYRQAGERFGVPWSLLAGIGWIESRHTPDAIGPPLDGSPGVRAIPATPYGTSLHGDRRWERAVGMMQFLPGTFRTYRDRGLVDDPRDPADAVAAAAAHLVDSGAPEDVRGALLAYNHSTRYVADVLDVKLKGQAGKEALDRWISWARRCRIPSFVKLQRRIVKNRVEIDAALDHGLSQGVIESTNTKIRVLTRIAFGFKSPEALVALALLSLGGYRPDLPTSRPPDDPWERQ